MLVFSCTPSLRARRSAAEEVGDGEDLLQLPAETGKAIRRRAWELLDVIELESLVGAERRLRC